MSVIHQYTYKLKWAQKLIIISRHIACSSTIAGLDYLCVNFKFNQKPEKKYVWITRIYQTSGDTS